MFKHVVVGFDGSKAAEKALDMAVEICPEVWCTHQSGGGV